MTQEWKIGDQAYLPVKITSLEKDEDGDIIVRGCCVEPDQSMYLDPNKLVSAPDPLTELERAVVEAGIVEVQTRKAYLAAPSVDYELLLPKLSLAVDSHTKAISDLLAARQPVDPVKELRAIANRALIAAAPRLLAERDAAREQVVALREALSEIIASSEIVEPKERGLQMQADINNARALLAKIGEAG